MSVRVNINDTVIVNNKPTITQIVYGVTWDEPIVENDMLIDLVMFGLNKEGKCVSNDDIYFFYNPELSTQRDIIIKHRPYNNVIKRKIPKEDKEQVQLFLDELPQRYDKLLFAIVVYGDNGVLDKSHNLSVVSQIQPHIFNYETKESILQHSKYSPDFLYKETCMILGQLERAEEGFFQYKNISQAFLGNLGTLFGIYLTQELIEKNLKESKN